MIKTERFGRNMYKRYPPQAIVIHHEGASNGLIIVDDWHRRRGFPKSSLGYWVGYTYYIDLSGHTTKCREEDEEGAHTLGGWNRKSVGICLRGDLTLSQPTNEQIEALQSLTGAIQSRWGIRYGKIYAHQELWPTLCPGDNLMPHIRELRQREPKLRRLEKQISLLKEAIERIKGLILALMRKQ